MSSGLVAEVETVQKELTAIKLDNDDQVDEERVYFQSLQKEVIKTSKGNITVAVQGHHENKRTGIITLHDIGQNHLTCFQSYFCFHQTKPLLNHFNIYHVNFPGQEEDAENLPIDYIYPTMEEMADVLLEITTRYGLKNLICIGVGAGANVFLRLALKAPSLVECLVLINGSCNAASWTEWGYEKFACYHLKSQGMTVFCQDYLTWHYFGRLDENVNLDHVNIIKDQLKYIRSPRNLGLFIESYSKRSAIPLTRPQLGQEQEQTTLKCGTLIITGSNSPAREDTIVLNSVLDPSKTSWIKVSDASSLVLDEKPTAVTNALVLFLQGHGFALKLQAPTLPNETVKEVQAPLAIC